MLHNTPKTHLLSVFFGASADTCGAVGYFRHKSLHCLPSSCGGSTDKGGEADFMHTHKAHAPHAKPCSLKQYTQLKDMHHRPHQQQQNLPSDRLPPHPGGQACPTSKSTTAPSTIRGNHDDIVEQDDDSRTMAAVSTASYSRCSSSSSPSSSCSPTTPSSTHKPPHTPTPTLGPCFLLLALAYMSSWTMMGALVSYFKQHHGPDFLVKLNCAYYLPGLPLALLQQHYESALDARFGSHAAYLARNLLAFSMLTLVLLRLPSVPASDASMLLGLTSVMGTFCWLAHGTASTVAVMFPRAAMAWLQSGFRMPEMYTLGMVSLLQIGAHPKTSDLRLLFHATAALVLTGAGAWVYLMSHPATRALLHLKDQGGHVSLLPVAGRNEERSGEEGEEEDALLLRAPSSDNQVSSHSSTSTTSTAAASHSSEHSTSHPSSVVVIRALSEAEKDFVDAVIAPCRWALFITISSSIFQASFLAYVRSSRPRSNYCVCELLYFVRLFADFLGRPLARLLPRPPAFSRPSQLVSAALARLSLLMLFLAYISFPTHVPQSDVFVTLLVAVFALLSGYLVVLSYEYAAQTVDYCKAYQAYAGSVMNFHFQAAGFVAVLCGLLFVDLGLCPSTIA